MQPNQRQVGQLQGNQQQTYLQSQQNQQLPYAQAQSLQQNPSYSQQQQSLSQGMPQGMSQGMQRGVVGQVLTPYNISQSALTILTIGVNNNTLRIGQLVDTTTISRSTAGVTIQFQLRGYSNPQFALPNGWTCVCPVGYNCSYLKIPPTCYFSFTFIISAPDTSVRGNLATAPTLVHMGHAEWLHFPNASRLPGIKTMLCQHYRLKPVRPYPIVAFCYPLYPCNFQSAIDIFAHNLGAVINQADGTLVSDDTLTHADTFVVPLSDALPAVGGVQSMSQQHTYQGKLLGNPRELQSQFNSDTCSRGSLIGPDCDLTCNQSAISSSAAACRSNATGFFYVCNYQSGGQVDNCKSCPWGIKEDTYCQDEGGGVLDPYHSGVVGTGFRTATIILSVIVLVFLILLLLLLFAVCILLRRRRPVEKEMTTYEQNGYTASTPSSRPLLTAAYRAEQPTPQPRSQPPSLEARPIKSSIRKAMSPPEQYNDSRDTSFNSDSPLGVRQSRSAVV
ncbi:hypothetical protein OSTOST_10037 [Ostertagia ostertagi]